MPQRMVILTEGHTNPRAAKTATSVIRYRPNEVVALLDSTQAGQITQTLLGVGDALPVIATLADAPEADTLLIGIAPPGGKLPRAWHAVVREAIERGLNIVSGLHDFLGDDPELAAAAQRRGVQIYDVRKNSECDIVRRQGLDPSCLRIHTVGNDCSVGKMVTAIEITNALKAQGYDGKFVATGQTGIMVEGDGCPIDCVVADFVNGAAEKLVLTNQHHKILLIEGQGSLAHPSYSAVTLGLLHGSLPDGLILCYEATRETVAGMPDIRLPSLEMLRELYETMAGVMHPARVIGVSMNSRLLTPERAEVERKQVEDRLSLPVCDVLRHGPGVLVSAVLKLKEELGK